MSSLEVGHVLSLKIRFNNTGQTAKVKHPYLIVGVDAELSTIELAQLDSLAGKEYKAAMKSNKVVYCDDPVETVIDKDSYIQMDNILKIELYDGLEKYRRQTDKLSAGKLDEVLRAYYTYHDQYQIDEDKQVYMSQEELEGLQK